MHDDPPPRRLSERTGRHLCIDCLKEIASEEYFRNDHLCDECAAKDEYPLQSTPSEKKEQG